MSIRKTGAVTGQVTGVDAQPEQGITAEAAVRCGWTDEDDTELAAENTAADG